MNADTDGSTRCSGCDKAIDLCACCEDETCESPICRDCLSIAVGQSMPQPHSHGG